MPVSVLSLFGFLDQPVAIQWLQQNCTPAFIQQTNLPELWQTANDLTREPFKNAGCPQICPIPEEHIPYLQQVASTPMFQAAVQGFPWKFALAEIDPIIAPQIQVSISHSERKFDQFPTSITIDETVPMALPINPDSVTFSMARTGPSSGLWIQGELGLCVQHFGPLGDPNTPGAGIVLGSRMPYVQVVHVGGRYYLRNGFHRMLGIRKRGGTLIPAVVIDIPSLELAGLHTIGMPIELLNSDNPPTCGHYTNGRAIEISVKKATRMIHLTVDEAVVLEV